MRKSNLPEILPRIIIGLVLLFSLATVLYSISQCYQELKFHHGIDMHFANIIKAAFLYSNYFVVFALLVFSLIVFFIHNVIGWIVISNMFYYMVFNIFFIVNPMSSNTLLGYLFIFFFLCLIVLLNLKSVRLKYKVINYNIVTINLITVFTGLLFVYLNGFIHLNYNLNIFDIVNELT